MKVLRAYVHAVLRCARLFRLLMLPGILLFLFSSTLSAQTVTKQLYLSDPSQSLDRIDPVATADATTATSSPLSLNPAGIVAVNTSTGYSANPGSITFTLSHTVSAGDNRLLLVGISQKNKLVSSVTYGGVNMTLVGENVSSGGARMHIYMLLNPAVGTANVVVNLSVNPDKGIAVSATTFTGVNQTTPLGTFNSASGNSNTATTTVSSAANELVYDVATFRNTTMTQAAGQTALYNINTGGEIDGAGASTKAGAASVTMTWNAPTNHEWAIGAVPIKPAPAIAYTTFTQAPALCSALTIKSGTAITVTNYLNVVSGVMPGNPNITADLKYGSTTIVSLSAPTYNNGTGLLTWTGTLLSDVTVPAGDSISLVVTTAQAGVTFRIEFDSQTKPSKINLPVSTYINVNSVGVYTAAYPSGIPITNSLGGTVKYLRAVVSDPFGYDDITSLNFTINPGSTVAGTSVATSGCTRIYEYAWSVPASNQTYTITATAKEGYENTVTHSKSSTIDACITCPPSAVNDSSAGPGGVPLTIDVLFNDSDPNNNLNSTSLSVFTQPRNGTAVISNGKLVYIPNGSFSGRDTVVYKICDNTNPTPLCATASVYIDIAPIIIDACYQSSLTHTYFIPYPEQDVFTVLTASSQWALPSSNVRTIISLKIPYPGMTITWDEWEDGYEANVYNPVQSTTKIWGDGNIYNGIAPGYPTDIIPAGGSIVLDNTMPANPRVSSNIFYDGKDKITSSGQIAMTQVCGEPSWISVQAMKTNITSVYDFGQSFTLPFGQDFNSRDFQYTALFVRAKEDNTTINIDKDNNGTFETTTTLNQGGSYLVNGGVLTGAIVTSDKPVGVEVSAGGVDGFSLRNAPIFPATWYSNTYYTPVPTSDVAGDNPKDTSIVMFYNMLSRPITINWSNGIPASGSFTINAKTAYRLPLAYSTTAAYKFTNPTGESFTAIQMIDSYTPGGGGNTGTEYDWAINLISEARLTDYATIAWAPGSTDGTRNDNPVWVTPVSNTTIYVKYDGDLSNGGSVSPCGLHYNVSYSLNALNYKKIFDNSDNDQGGLAVFTCDGVKLAAVYGEDPATAVAANPSWDVGSTIQPFCKDKMIFASDDYAETPIGQPVTISILNNDYGFFGTINPSSVNITGLLQAAHGTVTVNSNGTVLYRPNAGYQGLDQFEYQVCSTAPVKCDIAMVYIKIAACPGNVNRNLITGQVFLDQTKDGINNDGGIGFYPAKVYLYADGNCSGGIDANELVDSVSVDSSGYYQFNRYPEKTIADNFDSGTGNSCASGSDGNTSWLTNWVDAGEGGSTGYCVTPVQSNANTDAEIVLDGAFSYALRLDDNNVSATRTMNLSGASKAFFSFSYRRASSTLIAGENVYVLMSTNGTAWDTIYTINGSGASDAAYVRVYNQEITSLCGATTYLRFLTNNLVDEGDYVFFDDISIQYLKYNQCYITKLDPSSVVAGYYTTTSTEYATTFTATGTCASNKDFGIAKSSIAVSGYVYNDANGLTDATVNGTATGTPGGVQLYAYLVNTSGKIAFKSTVNSSTGAFSFPTADAVTNYTLKISTNDYALFADYTAGAALPSGWISVGEDYGVNNTAGSNVEAGTPNSLIACGTGALNVSNIKFGIERLPDSDNKLAAIPHPTINQYVTLNGGTNPPVLSGSDPEDCSGGCLLTGKSLIIDAYPTNAELYYNGALVNDGDLINNFNANLLQIKITTATIGDSTVTFLYSYVDLAGKQDASPATYTIYWPRALPATGLVATANLQGDRTTVNWMTLSEWHTKEFAVERSIDNINFTVIADNIPAAGESHSRLDYTQADNVSGLRLYSLVYYRVKLYDLDGAFKYSNIVAVKLSSREEISAWPNPFTNTLNVSVELPVPGSITIRLSDLLGRPVRVLERQLPRGKSQVTISDLEHLPPQMYLLELIDESGLKKTIGKFLKL